MLTRNRHTSKYCLVITRFRLGHRGHQYMTTVATCLALSIVANRSHRW